jgi:hypothetical protein
MICLTDAATSRPEEPVDCESILKSAAEGLSSVPQATLLRSFRLVAEALVVLPSTLVTAGIGFRQINTGVLGLQLF